MVKVTELKQNDVKITAVTNIHEYVRYKQTTKIIPN